MLTEDLIPAVVYGHGMAPTSVTVIRHELRKALSGPAGMNTVLDLNIDGKIFSAIIKELQRHPVRRNVQHIDFLQVNLNEEITVSIPVHLTGESKAVAQGNGLIDAAVDTIEVRTTPRNIPDQILIDVSGMTMESIIHIGDIEFPAGVVPTASADRPVVVVLHVGDKSPAPAAAAADAPAGA